VWTPLRSTEVSIGDPSAMTTLGVRSVSLLPQVSDSIAIFVQALPPDKQLLEIGRSPPLPVMPKHNCLCRQDFSQPPRSGARRRAEHGEFLGGKVRKVRS